MKNINLTILIMIILYVLVGCAGFRGNFNYEPPLEVKEQKYSIEPTHKL